MPVADYQVQSLARAAALLRAFSMEEPLLTIGELSARTRLPRSTVHRLVVNLVHLGLLARDPISDKYRPGLMLVRLGNLALGRRHLRDLARPVMERLVRHSGESSVLAALDGDVAVYVEKAESERRSLSITSRVGDLVPLHCTGTGKCLLAFVNPDEAIRLLRSNGLPRRTGRTIADLDAMLVHLAEIRARGYAVDGGESEEGLASIAAPVWDAANRLAGALCVAGPSERVLAEEGGPLASMVRAAADEISRTLGADDPSVGPADGAIVDGESRPSRVDRARQAAEGQKGRA